MFRRVLTSFIFLIFCTPFISYADAHLRINEVMYNPEGADADHEWVEIYNDGSESIDIASWYFWEGNTYHGLHPDGFTQLTPGEYALIVRNLDTARSELGSSNRYIKASFSLNNTGELLRIANNAKETIDEVSYQSDWGGNGNGKSLQYIGSSWREGNPTQGRENTMSSFLENSGGNENTSVAGGDTSQEGISNEENISKENPTYHIFVPVFTQKLIAGERFRAKIRVMYGDEEVHNGLFLVNFGDGNLLKTGKSMKEYVNRYIHPGRYLFIFEYYSSPFFYQYGEKPEILFRKIIDVEERETITIERVNPYDGVVIRNSGGNEIELEGWFLRWNGKKYAFPHATILLPHEILRISFRTLGFSPYSTRENKVSLVSNANIVVSSYPVPPYSSQQKRVVKASHTKDFHVKQEKVDIEKEDIDFDSLPTFFQERESNPFQGYLEEHPGKVLVTFSQEEDEYRREKEISPFGTMLPLAIALFLTVISSLIAIVSFSRRVRSEEKEERDLNNYHIELVDEE